MAALKWLDFKYYDNENVCNADLIDFVISKRINYVIA